VADVKSLLEKQAALGSQLDGLHAAGDRRASLSQALVDSKSAVMAAASQLHIDRMNHVDVVTSAVEKTLKSLNMPDASLAIDCQELPQPSKDGLWQYHFMFSANKGSKPMPIAKVASGGEQSRLMLALKKLFVVKKGLQTMLFDEIDSGISGQTASKVAGIFQEMGMQGQILAITHLPQVAAAGQHHWLVDKQGHGGQTETSLRILDKKDRQLEVARMLAGDAITETALAQASNLLGTS
jgi:DNA repair protein RecN (Recombination protein N)